ncbi:hypothetical protein MCEMIH15_01156 [Caulobacteraceae bacterium]
MGAPLFQPEMLRMPFDGIRTFAKYALLKDKL